MSLLRHITTGLTAGLAGAAAMHVLRIGWEAVVSSNSRHTIFGFDREADVNSARLSSQFLWNRELDERSAARLGLTMHYAFGAALGIAYSLAWPRKLSALSFGAVIWLCADEIPISVAGISDPSAKSAASHGSALVAHFIFGSVTDAVMRVLQTERSTSR